MLRYMYSRSQRLWCDGVCAEMFSPNFSALDFPWWEYNGTSFHSQHYLLWLGLTPRAGVPAALAYLKR